MVHSSQTAHLSCVKISIIYKQTQTRFHLRLVTSDYGQVRPKRYLSLLYIWCKPCTYIAPTLTMSPNGPKRDSTRPTHLGVPSGASNMIFELMEHSTQTAHLSCVKITTISKQTQTSFHLTLITKEYRRVRTKRFLSLLYVRRKPCTYIAPTQTQSLNGLKRDST
jgi:hypothetical protein